jgi:hypothetical protein
MRRNVLALALAALVALVAVGPARAVTNGEPDGDRHPYVGLLVFDVAPGQPAWRCSGSLISPTVVLTAGHCTEGAVAARAWFQPDVTSAVEPTYPFPGGNAVEGTPYTHPDYNVDNPYGGGNGLPAFSYRDIGVVVLDSPVTLDEYAELPTAGFTDTLRPKTAIDYVGYGVQEQVMSEPGENPFDRWTGQRIRMYAQGALVPGRFVHSPEYLRLTLNPGGGKGGTCFGDSGGPDLLAGTEIVLGVNSYVTNVNCAGVGYSSRVDVPDVLDWIEGFLA